MRQTTETHYCHVDALGLPHPACWDAMLDQYRRGWTAGYAAYERDLDEHLTAQVAQIARNVAGDPARTWAPAGQPQRRGITLGGGGR